jgi:hypothetical protein
VIPPRNWGNFFCYNIEGMVATIPIKTGKNNFKKKPYIEE